MQRSQPRPVLRGFTLIEVMVVISFIALMASVVIGALGTVRDQAKYTRAVKEMDTIYIAAMQYKFDTGVFSSRCDTTCNEDTDPFLVAPVGVAGWKGPYDSVWDKAHPWGGSYSISQYEVDGVNTFSIVLDDDQPGMGPGDNQGLVPTEALVAVDRLLDNGDLATGSFFGDGRDEYADPGPRCPAGEGCWTPFR